MVDFSHCSAHPSTFPPVAMGVHRPRRNYPRSEVKKFLVATSLRSRISGRFSTSALFVILNPKGCSKSYAHLRTTVRAVAPTTKTEVRAHSNIILAGLMVDAADWHFIQACVDKAHRGSVDFKIGNAIYTTAKRYLTATKYPVSSQTFPCPTNEIFKGSWLFGSTFPSGPTMPGCCRTWNVHVISVPSSTENTKFSISTNNSIFISSSANFKPMQDRFPPRKVIMDE